VRNPLRSEADAFRFLLLTIGYFALIVIGSIINTWLGLAVFVVLTLVVLYVAFIRGRDEPPPRVAPTMSHPDDERRILVIANETVAGDTLHAMIRQKSAGYKENVLVVAPIQPSPLQHLASDEDVVVSSMQPLDYDLKRKVEWRFANGKPFAVIFRIDVTKGSSADGIDMWSKENKTGEALVVKGLKGFEHIDFEVDAKTPNANAKAREMADAAYAKKP